MIEYKMKLTNHLTLTNFEIIQCIKIINLLKTVAMDTLELKRKIIQQIDLLNEAELVRVYLKLIDLLESTKDYKLSIEENDAIDVALKVSEEGETYSIDEINSEARKKYPNLKFK